MGNRRTVNNPPVTRVRVLQKTAKRLLWRWYYCNRILFRCNTNVTLKFRYFLVNNHYTFIILYTGSNLMVQQLVQWILLLIKNNIFIINYPHCKSYYWLYESISFNNLTVFLLSWSDPWYSCRFFKTFLFYNMISLSLFYEDNCKKKTFLFSKNLVNGLPVLGIVNILSNKIN